MPEHDQAATDEVRQQLHEREAAISAIEEILTDFGVHAGHWDARRELAERSHADGLTAHDALLIAEHLEQTADDSSQAARLIAWRLEDPERWGGLLADIRRFEKARRMRQDRTKSNEPGQGEREKNAQQRAAQAASAPKDWQEAELDRHLLAVWRSDLRSDRDSIPQVAARLGVSVDRAVLGIGRELKREGVEGGIDGWLAQFEAARKRVRARLRRGESA